MIKPTLWNEQNEPRHTTLADILYGLRVDDGDNHLLMDSVSMADILDDADEVMALDALVLEYGKVDLKMAQLAKALDRASGELKVAAQQTTDPIKKAGRTMIATIYELTDGQTVTVFFHNPDTSPNKLTAKDELVSFKWLLNKKNITVVVAPENGQDLPPQKIAGRIMALAEKNSKAFARNFAKRAAAMAEVSELKDKLEQADKTLTEKVKKVALAEADLDEKKAKGKKKAAETKVENDPEATRKSFNGEPLNWFNSMSDDERNDEIGYLLYEKGWSVNALEGWDIYFNDKKGNKIRIEADTPIWDINHSTLEATKMNGVLVEAFVSLESVQTQQDLADRIAYFHNEVIKRNGDPVPPLGERPTKQSDTITEDEGNAYEDENQAANRKKSAAQNQKETYEALVDKINKIKTMAELKKADTSADRMHTAGLLSDAQLKELDKLSSDRAIELEKDTIQNGEKPEPEKTREERLKEQTQAIPLVAASNINKFVKSVVAKSKKPMDFEVSNKYIDPILHRLKEIYSEHKDKPDYLASELAPALEAVTAIIKRQSEEVVKIVA